ncbi:Nucleolar protein 12 [Coemansia sp. BCRC 34962]|nr:Nucleolar protein 12 [Coemansia sp. BCRC 34962]
MAGINKGELSQLLVGGAKGGAVINSTLDDLFKNAPPQAPIKPVVVRAPVVASEVPEPVAAAEPASVAPDSSEKRPKRPKKEKKPKQASAVDGPEPMVVDEDERTAKAKRARRIGFGTQEDGDDSEAEESAAKRPKKKLLGRMPQDPEVIKRTLFIGNLSIQCITDKAAYGQLKTMCTKYGKVKAIRFRSIAFAELLPRKIAFIQGKFHSERQSCNAYVEFVEEEAAKKAVELNGSEFCDRHIRVDMASNDKSHDMKRSVFVGNLDFAADEEELWKHFGTCGTVENVRVIRDPKTSIGKGFAYVQFTDRAAVTLALRLQDTVLNSRKLRVQRASEKAIKEKERATAAAGTASASAPAKPRAVFEGNRSVKGDKPSNKKRRTARSKAYAEERLNAAKKPSAAPAPAPRSSARGGSRGGRGGSRGGRGGSRGGFNKRG